MRWMTSTLAAYAHPQANDPWANNQAPGAQQPAQQPMDTYEWSAAMFPLRIVRDHQMMTIRAQLNATPQQPSAESQD
jgi:hypothetical protein